MFGFHISFSRSESRKHLLDKPKAATQSLESLQTDHFIVPLFALTLQADSKFLLKPESAEMNQRTPDVCHVRLQTTKGEVRLEMRREWAPNGVDRFYNGGRRFVVCRIR